MFLWRLSEILTIDELCKRVVLLIKSIKISCYHPHEKTKQKKKHQDYYMRCCKWYIEYKLNGEKNAYNDNKDVLVHIESSQY